MTFPFSHSPLFGPPRTTTKTPPAINGGVKPGSIASRTSMFERNDAQAAAVNGSVTVKRTAVVAPAANVNKWVEEAVKKYERDPEVKVSEVKISESKEAGVCHASVTATLASGVKRTYHWTVKPANKKDQGGGNQGLPDELMRFVRHFERFVGFRTTEAGKILPMTF